MVAKDFFSINSFVVPCLIQLESCVRSTPRGQRSVVKTRKAVQRLEKTKVGGGRTKKQRQQQNPVGFMLLLMVQKSS